MEEIRDVKDITEAVSDGKDMYASCKYIQDTIEAVSDRKWQKRISRKKALPTTEIVNHHNVTVVTYSIGDSQDTKQSVFKT